MRRGARPAVTVRAVDVRFVLPIVARTATVVDASEGWAEALEAGGVEIRPDAADVAITSPQGLSVARRRARFAVVEGAVGGGTRLLVLPPGGDTVMAAAGHGAATALRRAEARSAVHLIRNRVAATAARHGVLPRRLAPITVVPGLREPPAIVAAAAALGAEAAGWNLLPGRDDPRSKSAFLTFDAAGRLCHVVKFQRTAGATEQLDRAERGLAIAAGAGRVVASRAPRLVGRGAVAGHGLVVETAVQGRPLTRLFEEGAAQPGVEAVARWLTAAAVATAQPGGPVDDRDRLQAARAAWPAGAPPVDDALPQGLPGVVVHGDLWEDNVFVDGDRIAVIDWDGSRRAGLPLWDTLYFGLQALPLLDGARDQRDRARLAMALLDGTAPSSPILRSWLATQVGALSLPDDAPGATLTLCLLDLLVRAQPGTPQWFLPEVARHWVGRRDWRWAWRS